MEGGGGGIKNAIIRFHVRRERRMLHIDVSVEAFAFLSLSLSRLDASTLDGNARNTRIHIRLDTISKFPIQHRHLSEYSRTNVNFHTSRDSSGQSRRPGDPIRGIRHESFPRPPFWHTVLFERVLVLCFIVSRENNLFYWNVSSASGVYVQRGITRELDSKSKSLGNGSLSGEPSTIHWGVGRRWQTTGCTQWLRKPHNILHHARSITLHWPFK